MQYFANKCFQTNLVDRPSAEVSQSVFGRHEKDQFYTKEAELSNQEMVDSVPVLLRKVSKFRPRILCFVGKGIWTVFEKGLKAHCKIKSAVKASASSLADAKGKQKAVFEYGLQPHRLIFNGSDDEGKARVFIYYPLSH